MLFPIGRRRGHISAWNALPAVVKDEASFRAPEFEQAQESVRRTPHWHQSRMHALLPKAGLGLARDGTGGTPALPQMWTVADGAQRLVRHQGIGGGRPGHGSSSMEESGPIVIFLIGRGLEPQRGVKMVYSEDARG